MPAISEQEAIEYERLFNVGYKLLERGKMLVAKEQLTETEERELTEINRQLCDIDNWFTRTAK